MGFRSSTSHTKRGIVSGFTNKFVSTKQEWETPPEIFDPLHKEFGFSLDAAADTTNTKCKKFFTEQDDGMMKSWGRHTVWLNPPYGNPKYKMKDWVKRAYEQSIRGATVVMLIPARTNTVWFHDYCFRHGEVRFIKGRPKFIGCKHGLPWPLAVVIFRGAEV
jgi:phage N-6-adenine-methyltransferase